MTRFAPQTLQPKDKDMTQSEKPLSLLGRIVKAHVLNVTPERVFEKAHSNWGIIVLALLCIMAAGLLLSE